MAEASEIPHPTFLFYTPAIIPPMRTSQPNIRAHCLQAMRWMRAPGTKVFFTSPRCSKHSKLTLVIHAHSNVVHVPPSTGYPDIAPHLSVSSHSPSAALWPADSADSGRQRPHLLAHQRSRSELTPEPYCTLQTSFVNKILFHMARSSFVLRLGPDLPSNPLVCPHIVRPHPR